VREEPDEPEGRPADRAGAGVRRAVTVCGCGVGLAAAVAAACGGSVLRRVGVGGRGCGGKQRWTIGLGCVCEAYLGRAGSSKRPKFLTGKRKNRASPRNVILCFSFFRREKKPWIGYRSSEHAFGQ
jgi:hypothetical protein